MPAFIGDYLRQKYLALLTVLLLTITILQWQPQASAGGFAISAIHPPPRTLTAPVDTHITIQFSQAVDTSTVNNGTVRVFGRWSGAAQGTFGFADMNSTIIFTPTNAFSAGEQVMVVVSKQLLADGGSGLSHGYNYQFWTKSAVSSMDFQTIDTLNVRDASNTHTQAYGGVATDFNNDGWLDLSIINEQTDDVRIFLNKADGTGLFSDFEQPTTPVGNRASPNEPSDFNNDGNADLAVANINTDSISILLGNGDGTFAPQQQVAVGDAPRGIAVLDVDGDGDTDIVNTNSNSGNLSLLLNDGNGVFGAPTFFDGGGVNEWALAAADMNEDGILDLVVGTGTSNNPKILINLGNGDGTFTFASAQDAGGFVWMLNASDLNGDGHEDVATANSGADNGAISLGDGVGNLAPPTVYNIPDHPFPLATDVGDIDGDGDLDWVTSSYAGDWLLFLNDGHGEFTREHVFPSQIAASCALFLDSDNNGTLDLALIDEIIDEVILVQNLPPENSSPVIEVSTTSVMGSVAVGGVVTAVLGIENAGISPLNWSISETSCTQPADVSWLTLSESDGTVAPAGMTDIVVNLNATDLTIGETYHANLCIASNDPVTPTQAIAVALTVTQNEQRKLYLPLLFMP